MSLYDELQRSTSEEDVKASYIRHLKLQKVNLNLIDIQTKEIWFETKHRPTSPYAMFTQLLHYVAAAYHGEERYGAQIPPLLAVGDSEKAALMETRKVEPLLKDKEFKWGKRASSITDDLIERTSPYIGTNFVLYNLQDSEKEFVEAVHSGIKGGAILREQIRPNNLKRVFDLWCEMIGKEIIGAKEEDWSLLFYADLMNDGSRSVNEDLVAEVLFSGGKPVFNMKGQPALRLSSQKGYQEFWSIYHRPPAEEDRNYLLERRDSLIPLKERQFKGAYYTPLQLVDKAYGYLDQALGKNWQKDYYLWDMCCGVGNLEAKHGNHRNLFMSTLDQADIDIMQASKTCQAATRFQYDYLNDDITPAGTLDYNLTNKLPKELLKIIHDHQQGKAAKKVLVLINPPFAEATSLDTRGKGEHKPGIAKSKVSQFMMEAYGKAKSELFAQFLVRISQELPFAKIAFFSTQKYISAQSFEVFRHQWKADFKAGLVVHNKAFDGSKGEFPIGFAVWSLQQQLPKLEQLEFDVYDKNLVVRGIKSFIYSSTRPSLRGGGGGGVEQPLNLWIERPRTEKIPAVPMKSALNISSSNLAVTTTREDALGYMAALGNDVQNAVQGTFFVSSVAGAGHGFYLTAQNLEQAAMVFTARRSTPKTWLNNRDQFYQPLKPPTPAFALDCLVYMLFHNGNQTSAIDGLEWNNQTWSITNHFVPFTEQEVQANGRFESNFMSEYLAERQSDLSAEAKAVLEAGKHLWRVFFSETDEHKVRTELKINRPDAGWYQVRNALKRREPQVSFQEFRAAYDVLTAKLVEAVKDYGFLHFGYRAEDNPT